MHAVRITLPYCSMFGLNVWFGVICPVAGSPAPAPAPRMRRMIDRLLCSHTRPSSYARVAAFQAFRVKTSKRDFDIIGHTIITVSQ